MQRSSSAMVFLKLQIFLIFIIFCGTTAATSHPTALGTSIYLPHFNVLGDLTESGVQIFKPLPASCFLSNPAFSTARQFSYYKNTESFYTSLTTSTNLDVSLQADYSLGFSLDSSTKGISGATRTVSGNSLKIMASSRLYLVSETCLNNVNFTDEFLYDLSNLPKNITSPWLGSSWKTYDTFLKKYGSHVVTAVTTGSLINQMSFAETSQSYSERDFEVRSCASLAGPTEVGKLNVSLCTNVTKEEISKVTTMTMSDSLTLNGGTTETRNKLLSERTAELIEQFMNEANATNASIAYTLNPIWERIQEKFIGSSDNFIKGINMEYYYLGYMNFGCPYKHEGGQDLTRFDLEEGSTPDMPQYECTLAPEGCHSSDDCHYKPIWCSCKGPSCVRYKTIQLDTGAEKKTSYMNTGEDWGWHGCDWKVAGFKCHCYGESQQRLRVWSSEGKNNAAYNAHYAQLHKKSMSSEDKDEL